MEYVNLSGNDFDAAVAALENDYDIRTPVVTPSELPFSWSVTAAGDATLSFRTNKFLANLDTVVGASDVFVVLWNQTGPIVLGDDATDVIHPKTPFIRAGDVPARARSTNWNLKLVHLDKGFLRTVAEELDDVHFITFGDGGARSRAASIRWQKTVDLVGSVVLDNSTPTTSLLRREVSRLMAIAMLDTFPYQSTDRVSSAAGVEPVAVRVAYEFVHRNAHLPIGPADIAEAAGVSIRSLQQALRRYRETTPLRLLHSVRLDRVHTQLLAADSRHTSISAVAREWGFVHLGRFAGSYNDRHGESPRETLRHTVRRFRS